MRCKRSKDSNTRFAFNVVVVVRGATEEEEEEEEDVVADTADGGLFDVL